MKKCEGKAIALSQSDASKAKQKGLERLLALLASLSTNIINKRGLKMSWEIF